LEVLLCPEETEPVLQAEGRVQGEDWDKAVAEAGWEGRDLGQAREEIVFALIAAQWLPIRWGHLATA